MAKTNVKVTLDDDEIARNIIIKTVKALRFAKKDREADDFQQDVILGIRPLREIAEEYVVFI